MSVRLRKHQIDKADRGKEGKKFADNFNVTLFLIRPSNQTLQDEFLRPNYIAQVGRFRVLAIFSIIATGGFWIGWLIIWVFKRLNH